MNYQKIHDQIIFRAQNRKLEGYKERHHIIPKSLGGDNSKQNIVELTAREHFVIHWLLHRIYPKNTKLSLAFFRNCYSNSKKREFAISSRSYEEAKIAAGKAVSLNLKGIKRGKMSQEHKDKLSNSLKDRTLSNEHVLNIGKAQKRRTKETQDKMNASRPKQSEATKEKIRQKLLGIKLSPERIQNIINAKARQKSN